MWGPAHLVCRGRADCSWRSVPAQASRGARVWLLHSAQEELGVRVGNLRVQNGLFVCVSEGHSDPVGVHMCGHVTSGSHRSAGLEVGTGACGLLQGRAAPVNAHSGSGTWPACSTPSRVSSHRGARHLRAPPIVIRPTKACGALTGVSVSLFMPDNLGLLPLMLSSRLLVPSERHSFLPGTGGEKEPSEG